MSAVYHSLMGAFTRCLQQNKLCYAGQQQHRLCSPALYMVTMSQPSSSGGWWGPAPLLFMGLPVSGFLGTNLGSCTGDSSLVVWCAQRNSQPVCHANNARLAECTGGMGLSGEVGLRQVSPNKIFGALGSRRWFFYCLGAPAARQSTK